MTVVSGPVEALPLPPGTPPALLGESPFWHPDEAALYWCDIPGRGLHRWHPASGVHTHWPLDSEPGCAAPLPGGQLLLAMRDGLFRFDPRKGERTQLAAAPYAPEHLRFNDGKADAAGRLWVGTIDEQRGNAAALYRWDGPSAVRIAGDIGTSNGLAWSPDGRTLYWADTRAHVVRAFDFDIVTGSLSRGRVFAQFAPRAEAQPLQGPGAYGGRPDGAAVDAQGFYWSACFGGGRVIRWSPDGRVDREIEMPVTNCTMCAFGGSELKPLFVTSARDMLSAEQLGAEPLAGALFALDPDISGLPEAVFALRHETPFS